MGDVLAAAAIVTLARSRAPAAPERAELRRARERMVSALAARGVSEPRLLEVMGRIPRQRFVAEAQA